MTGHARFRYPRLSVPPGGYYLIVNGERVSAATYDEIIPLASRLLKKHNIEGSAETAIADCMCARLGVLTNLYCELGSKFPVKPHPLPAEVLRSSLVYAGRNVVQFDRIEARLQRCLKCSKHVRDWCTTCNGHLARVVGSFNGRRPELPIDRGAGVCLCAGAYVSALCSVEFGGEDQVWPDVPPSCWRNQDV